MNVKLSRRVAKAMAYPPILGMTIAERNKIGDAVVSAKDFDDLPKKYRKVILEAEKNM